MMRLFWNNLTRSETEGKGDELESDCTNLI